MAVSRVAIFCFDGRSSTTRSNDGTLMGGNEMRSQHSSNLKIALAAGAAMIVLPAFAAEVTPRRLANPEPQNWLMNHGTYDGQRFSPLTRINRDNVKGLKLAYAVALSGSAGNEFS